MAPATVTGSSVYNGIRGNGRDAGWARQGQQERQHPAEGRRRPPEVHSYRRAILTAGPRFEVTDRQGWQRPSREEHSTAQHSTRRQHHPAGMGSVLTLVIPRGRQAPNPQAKRQAKGGPKEGQTTATQFQRDMLPEQMLQVGTLPPVLIGSRLLSAVDSARCLPTAAPRGADSRGRRAKREEGRN